MSVKYTLLPICAVLGIWLAGGNGGIIALPPANLLADEPGMAVMSPSLFPSPQIGPTVSGDKEAIIERYKGVVPKQWGESVTGVVYRLAVDDKVMALTFDLCGGSTAANGYDQELVNYLEDMHIPATFFVSGQWLKANPEVFQHLADNRLFEIQSHGLQHKPLSTSGKYAYGIKGTENLARVIREVDDNGQEIAARTGVKPRFYRSGTNYYDEVAVAVARDMGYTPVGYNILGDAGATFNQAQVKQAILGAPPGSIVLLHANHPESATAEGLMEAVPLLLKESWRFVKLGEYDLVAY